MGLLGVLTSTEPLVTTLYSSASWILTFLLAIDFPFSEGTLSLTFLSKPTSAPSFLRKFSPVRAKLLQPCTTLCDPMDCNQPDSSVHGDSPGKKTEVGCHALLQGIFPTQRLNSHLFMFPALTDGFFTISATWVAHLLFIWST